MSEVWRSHGPKCAVMLQLHKKTEMNPYVAIGVAVLLAVSHGWAYVTGGKHTEQKWQAEVAEQTAKAREQEQIWQGVVNETSKRYLETLGVVRGRLAIALNSLRDRPDRPLPEAPRTDCKGATGAELSRPDAGFLAGEAARADQMRAAYALCLQSYDLLRK